MYVYVCGLHFLHKFNDEDFTLHCFHIVWPTMYVCTYIMHTTMSTSAFNLYVQVRTPIHNTRANSNSSRGEGVLCTYVLYDNVNQTLLDRLKEDWLTD